MSAGEVPAGYAPLDIGSAYLRAQGGFYSRPEAQGMAVGLRVAAHQVNANGSAHGGLIATLVDVAMSVAVLAQERQAPPSTINLNLDFAAPVAIGQWLSAHAEVYRRTARTAFVHCRISADAQVVGHASGVFRCRPANTPTGSEPTR